MRPKNAHLLPAGICDQIWRTIAIHDLKKVYKKSYTKKKYQEKLLHQLLIGDKSKGIPFSIDTCFTSNKTFDWLFTTEN